MHTLQALGLLEEGRLKEVAKVADTAGKEHGIEAALDKMAAEWAALQLQVLPYRETGTFVIKARVCALSALFHQRAASSACNCSTPQLAGVTRHIASS